MSSKGMKKKRERRSLTEEEIAKIDQMFAYYDRDNSGYIEHDEIRTALQSAGQNPSHGAIRKMIKEVDFNNDGKISRSEFTEMIKNCGGLRSDEEEKANLRGAFRVFDKNGDGRISRDELRHAMRKMGKEPLSEDEITDMFEMADVDGDGYVDYEEFCNVICSGRK